MRYPVDLTGEIIGNWEVLRLHELQYNIGMWECRCVKCGAIAIIPRKHIVRTQKRCDICSSHIDTEAYTGYLKSRRYSNIEQYLRVINDALDHYTEAQIMEAYADNNLDNLIDVIPAKNSNNSKKIRRREIRVYCHYVQYLGGSTKEHMEERAKLQEELS